MTALIFDTETHKLHGDIIEVAAIEIKFFGYSNAFPIMPTIFEYQKRFKPSEPIGLGAMAVHHIVDEDLVKCPSFTKFKLPKDDIQYLIGHNIDYDTAAVNRAGVATDGIKNICTLAMARYLWPTLEAHNLTALAYHISSDRKATRRGLKNAHSALNDCQTTYKLLLAIILQKEIKTFEELYEFSELTRYPSHIFYGKYKGWAIKDLDDKDIDWLQAKSSDQYLNVSLEKEIERRSIVTHKIESSSI